MNKVDIIKLAKALKRKFKKKTVHYVSYCRRIERIKTDKRICAMTFDDGPTYASNVTKALVETLNEFGAKGTFDVIGTTENNYPDEEGVIGTPSWSGVHFDHYPKFNADKEAGAENCPELIKLIIDGGHEITNHTYSHVLFGKKNVIYSKRNTLDNFDEVCKDVEKLHTLLRDTHGYEMKYSRPPHYVDKIKGEFTSYDVYSSMNYNYLAASFDGAGWLPCNSEEEEIEAMVAPLRRALEENPDSLCGQIIFQKDGYNMALRPPVKEGLKLQLELLKNYGYKVVSVTDLLSESPFADVGRDDADFEIFNHLLKSRAIAFTDNTLRPDSPMTRGELAMLLAPRDITVNKRLEYIKSNTALPYRLKATHPYSSAMVWAIDNGYIPTVKGKSHPDGYVDSTVLKSCEKFFSRSDFSKEIITRREILLSYKNIF